MSKLKKRIGSIILGLIIVLAGCGDGQMGGASGEQSAGINIDGSNVEDPGRGSQEPGDQGQVILTLGTYDAVRELTYAVEAYNAKNGKYKVEIVDYTPENGDYDAAEERMKIDLATGKGTDIIWMEDMVADELGYAGVLADLNAYLTPENREKYLTHILECAQTGDKLYEIAATFEIGFIAGNPSKLGEKTGWTIEEMLETFRANNKDANGIGNAWENIAEDMVEYAIDDFVDWDAGKADFCNQEFYDILKFCKNKGRRIKATQESVAAGTHLAVKTGINGAEDIQYLDWLFDDDWVVKGWPCNQGTGVTVAFWNSLAIGSYSQCPEGAWDFIEYYVTLDWIEDYRALHPDIQGFSYQSISGLPINRKIFEKVLDESMVQQYFSDTGEKIPLYVGEDGEPDFYANSAEDVEKIKEIVELADSRHLSYLSEISLIIREELSGYNSGTLTAEQTAEKIQNRVQLYLDEQRR